MTKSMFRLGYTLLISGIMVAAAEPSSSCRDQDPGHFLRERLYWLFPVRSVANADAGVAARFHIHWLNVESPDLLPDWFGAARLRF